MIHPRICSCGMPMEFFTSRKWPPPIAGVRVGVYWCAHCDRECVGATGNCPRCKAIAIKL